MGKKGGGGLSGSKQRVCEMGGRGSLGVGWGRILVVVEWCWWVDGWCWVVVEG